MSATAPAAYDTLPDLPALVELKSYPKWVAWKYAQRNGKRTKPPVSAHTGKIEDAHAPNTWASYAEAVARARRDKLPGVGFVLTSDDGLTGADLDRVRDAETCELVPWAAEIVALAETYVEVSPSGTGLRIIWRGKIDKSVASKPLSIEIYRDGRFLTITGWHVEGTPTEILPAPKTEAALRARLNGAGNDTTAHVNGARSRAAGEWAELNTALLQNLSAWVPALFPQAKKSRRGYRVSSKSLGRKLQEDISFTPNGIKDFGVHDMGDPREGRRSPIDLVMEHGAMDFGAAVDWLREMLEPGIAAQGAKLASGLLAGRAKGDGRGALK